MDNEGKLVLLLGRLTAGDVARQEAAVLIRSAKLDPTLLFGAAKAAKVLPVFISNLKQIEDDQAKKLVDYIAPNLLDPRLLRRQFRESLEAFVELLANTHLDVMTIKGSSLFFLTPEYEERALGDVDLMFRDLPDLIQATRHLLRHGYAIEEDGEAPWLSNFGLGEAYRSNLEGHFTLTGPQCAFDLHSRNMSVGVDMLQTDLWLRARRERIGTQTVWVPSPEDALLVLVAHSLSHGYLTLKDLNDAYVLLTKFGASFDWFYLTGELKRQHIDRMFSCYLDLLREYYSYENPVPASLRSSLRAAGPLGKWIRRAGLAFMTGPNLLKAWGAGLVQAECVRSEHGWFQGLQATIEAAARTGQAEKWLSERVARFFSPPPLQPTPLAQEPPRGLQIFLTDVTSELFQRWMEASYVWDDLPGILKQDGFEVTLHEHALILSARKESSEIVLSPAGMFVPTLDFTFTAHELERLEALGNRILDLVQGREKQTAIRT